MCTPDPGDLDRKALIQEIRGWSHELGFERLGVTNTELAADEKHLEQWIAAGYHGELSYMAKHGHKRTRPAELVEGTVSVISARMNYLPEPTAKAHAQLQNSTGAYISRYALGRDYHKLMRKRLQQLADRLVDRIGPFGYRVFTDSAPVMERALARKAGLGWVGKHTNLIDRYSGSWFFLGEIYTDLKLPQDQHESSNYCGSCTACIDICPTQAIIAPYHLDARRCISYLTIESKAAIPLELRRPMGNRVFGCDDCQLVCPWNRYAKVTSEPDFTARHDLDCSEAIDLFSWSEQQFLKRTEGSAIRRISFEQWSRNLAVALGNMPGSDQVLAALKSRLTGASDLLREHLQWAIDEQNAKLTAK